MYQMLLIGGSQAVPCMYLNHLEGLDKLSSWGPTPRVLTL